jgi:hypothetical protein
MNLRLNSRGQLHESQGGILRSSPLDQMVLRVVKWGRLDGVSYGQQQLKGVHQSRVHSDLMVLVMARLGGGLHEQWPKDT